MDALLVPGWRFQIIKKVGISDFALSILLGLRSMVRSLMVMNRMSGMRNRLLYMLAAILHRGVGDMKSTS